MGWEVLSQGTFLTPANVSKLSLAITDLLKNWLDHIPEEIIPKILVRLPIKSMVKCTSVCKSWRAIIKDPKFKLTHLTHKRKFNDHNATHLMLLHSAFSEGTVYHFGKLHFEGFKEDTYTLHFDNHGFEKYCKVEIPTGLKFDMVNKCYRVVGTCNGLICLADDLGMYAYNFALWNPCVRKYVILPEPFIRFVTYGGYEACIGMGYDAGNDDYKVVRVVTLLDQVGIFEGYPTLAQVYSLAKGSWGNVRSDVPRCLIPGRYLGHAFVNGVMHWLALRPVDDGIIYFVLTFDMSSEAFGEIMLPKRFKLNDPVELRLSATGDGNSIGLFVKCVSETDSFLDIWVMKEYGIEQSWTKLMILTPQGPKRSLYEAVCFRKNGEAVLVLEDSRELVALDLVSKQFKLLGVSGGQDCSADSYEESLVLLDREDAVSY